MSTFRSIGAVLAGLIAIIILSLQAAAQAYSSLMDDSRNLWLDQAEEAAN